MASLSVKSEQQVELSHEKLLTMLGKMMRIRLFEERVERLYKEGKISGPTHLYVGHEAVAVGVIEALEEDDPVVSTYRGHGHGIARGVPMKAVLGEILGRSVGTCKGLGGSMHAPISVEHGIPLATAIVGSGIPIAVGIGLAMQYRKRENIAVVFFGDGAVNTGAFHEALNLASVWRLPVLFVCENNLYAMTTSIRTVFGGESIASRAASYGMKSVQVSGNDVLEVYMTARDLSEQIRSGKGPAFMECLTYRFKGHGAYDIVTWYRSKEEVEEWRRKDPIKVTTDKLKAEGVFGDEDLKRMQEKISAELEETVNEVLNSPPLEYDKLPDLVYASK